mmetsp:Transcript_19930/g.55114  ORF Transcript_19930/g.55114 Transcript_19930/m.55114 type:complete len:209 (-) Transcript_19930:527-1153(-)
MFLHARPKSAILSPISLRSLPTTKMFSGFRSRCTTFFSWRYRTASHSCLKSRRAWGSVKQPWSRMQARRSPSDKSSITKYKCASVSNHSYTRTIPSWLRLIKVSASLFNERRESRFLWNCQKDFLLITFNARCSPVCTCTPSLTSLKLPLPMMVRMSQRLHTHAGVTKPGPANTPAPSPATAPPLQSRARGIATTRPLLSPFATSVKR